MALSSTPTESFEVIVVGGGHAGCEAAITAARLGLNTALFSLNLDRIAWQPCNPAAAGVEDALLDGGGIGQAADHPTEGIHFMDELAFGRAANGRIAGLPSDAIEIEAEQSGVQAQPGSRDRCFTAGMAAADHDHVEGFGGGGAEAHASII